MTYVWFPQPRLETPNTERLEWLTDVLPSYNGKEQRVRMRTHPRRQFEVAHLAESSQRRVQLENALVAAQADVLHLPIWPDVSLLGADLTAGATSIPVATASKDYAVGGLVVLISGGQAEVATISTVNADSLDVSALVTDWPAGAFVAPAVTARVLGSVSTNNPWPAVLNARVRFLCETEYAITPASESADYRGYPVLVPDHAWTFEGNTDFKRKLAEFDPKTGLRHTLDMSHVEQASRQYKVLLSSRAAIAAFRSWLAARAGRLNPVWMASAQPDLTITAAVGSADTDISIQAVGYVGLGAAPVGRRDIVIETVAGQRYYRRIVSAYSVSAAVEHLVLDTALGVSLAPADIARVSFMRLSRLAADAVEIAHHWGGAAVASLTMDSLRDDL